MMIATSPTMLTRNEAATYLSVKPQTLACWTHHGRYALPYVKVGRSVRYRLADLDAFLEARTVRPSETVEVWNPRDVA